MRKSLFVSCYFLRIEILINYLPIDGLFFKTFCFWWGQPAGPSWMSLPFPCLLWSPLWPYFTLLALTRTTPPLIDSGGVPAQQDTVLKQQETWISSFLWNLISLNSQMGQPQAAMPLTWMFYKHTKTFQFPSLAQIPNWHGWEINACLGKRGGGMDQLRTLASQAEVAFSGLSVHPCASSVAPQAGDSNLGEQPRADEDYSICMQVVNSWSRIKAEAGWINFESLIFINSSVREKYKEMTQLPPELRCRATALQPQVHNALLIDQEEANPYEGRWKSIRLK